MMSCTLKLSAHRMLRRRELVNFGYVIECGSYSYSHALVVRNVSPCVSLVLVGQHSCRALQKECSGATPFELESCMVKAVSDLAVKPGKIQANAHGEEGEEVPRREKKHGNKGRVPWNKGRKHSEETRTRIRYRTKEALNDPKVKSYQKEDA